MKDAVFHLFILDCIVQTKVNDKQEKSKFAFFLKIKLFVILEYLEFQKERRKEKKTNQNYPWLTTKCTGSFPRYQFVLDGQIRIPFV